MGCVISVLEYLSLPICLYVCVCFVFLELSQPHVGYLAQKLRHLAEIMSKSEIS
jgi:hypothetical protein